jgi:hypothetical protein
MKNALINNFKYYQDHVLFLLLLLAGIFTKIYFAINRGKKPTVSWFLAEAIVSLFVAFSAYVVCDQFLNLNKAVTYVICAWGGSLSTLIHSEVEELISSFFDVLKVLLKTKFK